METLHYKIAIDATRSRVWEILIGAETYKLWVKAFSPNSYMKGEWVQGTKVDFLDPDMGGTRAILEKLDPEHQIVAKHVALISKQGEVSTSGEIADKWLGTIESYQLITRNSKTELHIEITCHKDFVEMFDSGWPKALATIKELSESIV